MNIVDIFIKFVVLSAFMLQKCLIISTQEMNSNSTNVSSKRCIKYSNRAIVKCMQTFVSSSTSYKDAKQQKMESQKLLLKHLCFEYEKMLQCLHSSLTNCRTLQNIQQVQFKLGNKWVKKVNTLCIIHSADINKMDVNQTNVREETYEKENQQVIEPTENAKDNSESNNLPQYGKRINVWKEIQKIHWRKTMKNKLRHMFNRKQFGIFGIVNKQSQRTTGEEKIISDRSSSSHISKITNPPFIVTYFIILAFLLS